MKLFVIILVFWKNGLVYVVHVKVTVTVLSSPQIIFFAKHFEASNYLFEKDTSQRKNFSLSNFLFIFLLILILGMCND